MSYLKSKKLHCKTIIRTILTFLIMGNAGMSFAQTEAAEIAASSPETNIIEQEAILEYDVPDDILQNLLKNPSALKHPGTTGPVKRTPAKKTTPGVGKIDGFRVQVFSDGRNPTTLQSRARARGNAIVAKFPKYRGQIYSFSSSPNWYTRVGNFRTSEEASAALAELKRAFPAFAAEMRVVKSPITIYFK